MRALVVLLLVSGCATNSGVVTVGDGVYMISGSAPANSGGEVTASLYREANAYCAERKQELVTVGTKSRDAGFARPGNAEIQFRCAAK
jgi:hypothetical protein